MNQLPFAVTPEPPYWAVIFTSKRTEADAAGYNLAADRMVELARESPGFLGIESTRGADGLGITVSYWDSEASIARWRRHAEHQEAQRLGRVQWYARFEVRIAKVERAYRGALNKSNLDLSKHAEPGACPDSASSNQQTAAIDSTGRPSLAGAVGIDQRFPRGIRK